MCVCVCARARVYEYICTYILYTHTHTHAHTHTHTHTHTHKHTHTHTRERTSINAWGRAVAERPGNALTATYEEEDTCHMRRRIHVIAPRQCVHSHLHKFSNVSALVYFLY